MRLWHGHSRFWLTLNVPLTLSPHSVPGLTQLQGAQWWQGIKESYINQCSGEWLTDTPHMREHTINAIQRATRMIQRPRNLTLEKQSHTKAQKITIGLILNFKDEVCNYLHVKMLHSWLVSCSQTGQHSSLQRDQPEFNLFGFCCSEAILCETLVVNVTEPSVLKVECKVNKSIGVDDFQQALANFLNCLTHLNPLQNLSGKIFHPHV